MEVKIASKKEILRSRELWNNLVNSMKFPTIFLTWEWITPWIKAFEKDCTVLVLFLYESTELVAILPLSKKTIKLENGLFKKSRVLTICGSFEIYPAHLYIICKHDSGIKYIKKIIEFLHNDYKNWDILNLDYITKGGNIDSYFGSAENEYRLINRKSAVAPYISLEKVFEGYFKSINSKKRNNLKRLKRILAEQNNASFKKELSQEELDNALKSLFNLHQIRADEKGIKSTFTGREIYDFHKNLCKAFIKLDWLRIYFLLIDNYPIAVAYGFIFNKRFYYYQNGMAPEWKSLGPGKTLIHSILEDLDKENILEFDFLNGDEGYKNFWTENKYQMISYMIFNMYIVPKVEYG